MSGVFPFGRGIGLAHGASREVVGNKAWHLMRLAEAGLPVPPGFVIGTGWAAADGQLDAAGRERLRDVLASQVRALGDRIGAGFGGRRPLLLAVRSGAAASMPGMMDTVLDIGLSDATIVAMRRATGNPRLCWDSYRRLVAAFGETVLGVPRGRFADALADALRRAAVPDERELDVAALESLTRAELALVEEVAGRPFPQDPQEQLLQAVEAVLRSWMSHRAQAYRRLHGLSDAGGTAVTVQAMVFGNRGGASGAGVGFTRDPSSGEPGLFLDFLPDAQGEDVVSGRRSAFGAGELARRLPEMVRELERIATVLEQLFLDAQDFEFTVERGVLWLLQARTAKRTPLAALRIAVDLVREGRVSPETALARLDGLDLEAIAVERLVVPDGQRPLAVGVPASAGVGSGPLVLEAEVSGRSGPPGVLVRPDTSTDDLEAMAASRAIVTASGSRTSHAAVVARQLGRPCVVGCGTLRIDVAGHAAEFGGVRIAEGEVLTVDGTRGEIWRGALAVARERPTDLLAHVAAWRGRGEEGQ